MLTGRDMQGHGDGHHHDRVAERRQDVAIEGVGSESDISSVCVCDDIADSVGQGGEFTIEYVARQQYCNRCSDAAADRAPTAQYRL